MTLSVGPVVEISIGTRIVESPVNGISLMNHCHTGGFIVCVGRLSVPPRTTGVLMDRPRWPIPVNSSIYWNSRVHRWVRSVDGRSSGKRSYDMVSRFARDGAREPLSPRWPEPNNHYSSRTRIRMKIFETRLPGVGRRYQVSFSDGRALTIVIHNDGRREVF